MTDTYSQFKELTLANTEGVDFKIEIERKDSSFAIIAIHGGTIEKGTTEIARVIAKSDLSFYSFTGLKESGPRNTLHITSTNFDESQCIELVTASKKVVSIHGINDHDHSFIMVGGLDEKLKSALEKEFNNRGFETRLAPENLNGNSPDNICNKCISGEGIQLELTRNLRDTLSSDDNEMEKFGEAVRITLLHEGL